MPWSVLTTSTAVTIGDSSQRPGSDYSSFLHLSVNELYALQELAQETLRGPVQGTTFNDTNYATTNRLTCTLKHETSTHPPRFLTVFTLL